MDVKELDEQVRIASERIEVLKREIGDINMIAAAGVTPILSARIAVKRKALVDLLDTVDPNDAQAIRSFQDQRELLADFRNWLCGDDIEEKNREIAELNDVIDAAKAQINLTYVEEDGLLPESEMERLDK